MEFKLSEGPWKEIFKGNFNEYEIEIFTNPESLVLVVIYEREGPKKVGAVVELYKIFYSIGDVDSFVETLPREVISLTKHDEKSTLKFFLLGSSPSYVKYDENAIVREVDNLIKKLQNSATMIKDVSKAYNITFKELAECTEDIKEAFFAQPLLIPIMSTASHPVSAPRTELRAVAGEAILGITKEGTSVKEPISLFQKTIVSGGKEDERLQLIQILVESFLISNIAVVIFDKKGSFNGLSAPTKKTGELQKYKMDIEPIGFPVKEFEVPETVKIDINNLEITGLIESFGAAHDIVAETMVKAVESRNFNSINDVIKKINEVKIGGDFSEFQKLRAVRLLRLMDARYPDFFDGKNNVPEISKNWFKGIGRAGIINMSKTDERSALLVLQSLVQSILEHYKNEGPSKSLKSVIVVPSAEKILGSQEEHALSKKIANDLEELSKYGVGYVLGAEKSVDLTKKIVEAVEAKLSIIRENDAGVQLKDRKNYRVLLRPCISEFK